MLNYLDRLFTKIPAIGITFLLWFVLTFVCYVGVADSVFGDLLGLLGLFLVLFVVSALNIGMYLFSLFISLMIGIRMGVGVREINYSGMFNMSIVVITICNVFSVLFVDFGESAIFVSMLLGVIVLVAVMVRYMLWDKRNRKSNLIDEENSIE